MGLKQHVIEFEEEEKVEEPLKIFAFPSSLLLIPQLICFAWCAYLLKSVISSSIILNESSSLSLKEIFLNNADIQVFSLVVLLGLLIIYVLTATLFKYSSVDFQIDKIVISKGPLPWPGRKNQVFLNKIKQCRVERYWASFDPNLNQFYYRVWITLEDTTELLVDKEIENYEDAKNLESWISNFLHPNT